MNKQPVSYLQTDPRWSGRDYSAKGESTTIGKSGCGPTCAAMLIETLTGKTFTPADACAWALEKGYKAVNQGTYYSYFVPQFQAYGIPCRQLNSATLYGNAASSVHTQAFDLLQQGYYLIACMGPGLWTSSGHFVVVWWKDGKVRINDPASTADARRNGNPAVFQAQVKYYWAIDARDYNGSQLEGAVDALAAKGIITSPDYWKQGKGYSAQNVVSLLKKAAALCKTDELTAACCRLAAAGILDSPDYWAKGSGYSDENVAALLVKLSTLCK